MFGGAGFDRRKFKICAAERTDIVKKPFIAGGIRKSADIEKN